VHGGDTKVQKERKMSENGVVPSNEPWVPRWKQAENTALRERKLSEKDADSSSRRERDSQLSERDLRAKLWRQSDGNQFRKPSEKERKLSEKLEGVWSGLTAANDDDHAPISSEEESSVPTEAYDETCFHVEL
jgi:hypothetical protein